MQRVLLPSPHPGPTAAPGFSGGEHPSCKGLRTPCFFLRESLPVWHCHTVALHERSDLSDQRPNPKSVGLFMPLRAPKCRHAPAAASQMGNSWESKELCASSANSPTTLSRVPGGMENKHSAGGSSTRWLWDKEVPRGSDTHPSAQPVAAEGSPASEQNLFIYLLIIY